MTARDCFPTAPLRDSRAIACQYLNVKITYTGNQLVFQLLQTSSLVPSVVIIPTLISMLRPQGDGLSPAPSSIWLLFFLLDSFYIFLDILLCTW